MAVTSFHAETGRWLTSLGPDAKEGSVHLLTIGSIAYSLPKTGFGWQSAQFTRFTLGAPIGINEWGQPLFDLNESDPRCPIDNSPQNIATKREAEARELDRILVRRR